MMNLGLVAYDQGDYARARSLYEQAITIQRELGDSQRTAISLNNLALVASAQGDRNQATALLKESLRIRCELGDKKGINYALEGLAEIMSATNCEQKAVRLWGAAGRLRERIQTPLPPSERGLYEQQIASARSVLGDDAFAAAWEQGRALTLEQAVAYALEEAGCP
jgi:tetratricopeptide (TPR) repeat protein